MPRRSAAEALQTRSAIVERSVAVASVDGLDGLTIGRVAGELHMSKAGVLGHFGTKEGLQLAALEAAVGTFTHEVWEPAAGATPGRPRLLAVADGWLSYLERDVFPGGCFVTAAACEFDDRPGPVREALARHQARWLRALAADARVALRAGDLPRATDPADVAFGLNAVAMGVNQARRLLADPEATARGWRAMRALLHAPRARRRTGV
ncbi:TetR/AcrR family transcriptional regulator [Baekduia soli]|uniref:TetR/AcrR family transcriptional regulator n=1 Tax=Baekduia soli TaxID=496014 RepID=A0A5B8U1R3_9ACTN|nr:TetR/AcrR family transcriptional regulator [Baekduia soli]QEC46936.1 TetR/AcrR family transcriptional regulator [Baekduia soli]